MFSAFYQLGTEAHQKLLMMKLQSKEEIVPPNQSWLAQLKSKPLQL